ncbi:uncharacterized protein LOC128396621 [Panonychus citri]|uniref:uncharacterized protein LOC128396621 n=1 Tax=Panonychus citri TaxID=50023 RepID=UPI002306FB54|nr:uncharacterized protein LOC128396621 [Panonychus citri]
MPSESKVITSWADEGGDDDDYGSFDEETLPPPSLKIEGNTKIVTSYKYEDGKKYKVISHYKIERIKVSKAVSTRKQWKKYGKAIDDPPGPNSSNTICCEDVYMQFISSKDDENMDKDDPLQNLGNKNVVKCRYCEMDHWTLKCPYKDKFENKEKESGAGPSSINLDSLRGAGDDKKGGLGGKYLPPSLREGGNKRGDFLVNSKSKDEANTIRVTNLPEEIQDGDIKDLFHQFGKIVRIFLAKDKYTGQSKGFAFVSFDRKEDAAKAIKHVNGFGYANLILNVEWAKPSNNKKLSGGGGSSSLGSIPVEGDPGLIRQQSTSSTGGGGGGDDDDYGSFDEETLPPPSLEIEGNTKIVTSYKYEDGKKYKVISHYKIERIEMSKAASTRRQWKKYGKSIDDPPGPNSLNTICCEDVYMQFISCEDDENMDKDDPRKTLSNMSEGKCRNCGMDHWTIECPYKDKFENKEKENGADPSSINLDSLRGAGDDKKGGLGKSLPPSLLDGGNNRGDFLVSKDEAKKICVTNLPEEIQDGDIKDLFHQFGKIVRIFLAKDKYTGQSKGFAFVSFDRKEDAANAIKHVNGYGYEHLILNVEWAFDANRKSEDNESIPLKNYSQYHTYTRDYTQFDVELLSQLYCFLKKVSTKKIVKDKSKRHRSYYSWKNGEWRIRFFWRNFFKNTYLMH